MSAAELRRAASLMRERAEAATPGPWESDLHEVSQHWSRPEPWAIVASNEIACLSYCYGGSARGIEEPADAEHIASWHPVVALAVADWLEYTAKYADWVSLQQPDAVEADAMISHAAIIARAFLGESS